MQEEGVLSVICERFDTGAKGSYVLGAPIKLSQDLRGRAIYDGWAPPPERRKVSITHDI